MTSVTFRKSQQNPENIAGCYLPHFKVQERYHHNFNVTAKILCKMCNLMTNYTAGTVYFQSVSQWFVHNQLSLKSEYLYKELLNSKYL